MEFLPAHLEDQIIADLKSPGIERRKAEEELFKRYSYFITVGMKKYALAEEDAFNAYSDTVLVVLQSISDGSFEGRSSLKTYCNQIFHNKCVDLLRKKTARKNCVNYTVSICEVEGHLRDKSKTIVEQLTEQSEHYILKQIFNQLSKNGQRLLQLSLEGYSDKEIAVLMKFKSADVAKTCRMRALKGLRQVLQPGRPETLRPTFKYLQWPNLN